MKKATSKTAKTTPAQPAPSPAKKSIPKVSSVKVTEAALRAKAVASKPVVAAPAPEPIAASVSTPAKEDVPRASGTKIAAQIDVGFGNTLYIRGEGPGLSWEKGVVLDCVADDKWSITFLEAAEPVVFKFLINDQTWSLGDDFVAAPGSDLIVNPTF